MAEKNNKQDEIILRRLGSEVYAIRPEDMDPEKALRMILEACAREIYTKVLPMPFAVYEVEEAAKNASEIILGYMESFMAYDRLYNAEDRLWGEAGDEPDEEDEEDEEDGQAQPAADAE